MLHGDLNKIFYFFISVFFQVRQKKPVFGNLGIFKQFSNSKISNEKILKFLRFAEKILKICPSRKMPEIKQKKLV